MELSTLNRARNVALAAILAAGMTIPTTAVAYAADGDSSDGVDNVRDKMKNLINDDAEDESIPKKTESVYVFTHSDGSVKNTVVSNWLKNPQNAATLQDVSNLTDIQNTEGKETFTNEGGVLTWQAEGNDIYYQGNTEQATPVSIKVTYWLDGVQTAPEDLAGQSGHVKIRFDYTNNSHSVEYVDGAARTVYTPFACLTGMILDNDVFANVKTKNAKAMNDGDRTLVGGVAFPGLQADLDVDTDTVDIPDYIEVEADVTDFEMATTATIVSSNLLDSINTDELDTDDLDDSLNKLSDAMDQLIDGSSQLYDGMKKLDNGGHTLANGVGELQDKTSELPESAQALADGSSQLASGLTQAIAAVGAENVKNSLIYAAYSTNAGLNLLKNGNDSQTGLVDAVDGVNALKAGADQLGLGIGDARDGINQVKQGLDSAKQQVDGLGSVLTKDTLDKLSALGSNLSSLASVKTGADNLAAATNNSSALATGIATVGQYASAASGDSTNAATSAGEAAANITSAKTTLSGIDTAGMTAEQIAAIEGAVRSLDNAVSEATAAKDSATSAATNSATAKGAADQLETARTTINAGATGLSTGVEQVITADIKSELETAGTVLEQLGPSVSQLSTGLGGASATLDAIANGGTIPSTGAKTAGLAGAQTGAATISAGLSQLNNGGTTADGRTSSGLTGAVNALGDASTEGTLLYGTNATYAGAKKLKDEALTPASTGANQLADGLSQLNDAVPALAAGIQALKEGSSTLADGLDSATDGTKQLSEGIQTLNDEGIQRIVDAYNDNLAGLSDRLKATVQAGKDYNTFSGKNDSMRGSVKFIYETDAIELPDEE